MVFLCKHFYFYFDQNFTAISISNQLGIESFTLEPSAFVCNKCGNVGRNGCRTGRTQEVCHTGRMHDWRDAGKEALRRGGM